jgi:predicted ribosomally synthesized peptide with SipW-like signal peptide
MNGQQYGIDGGRNMIKRMLFALMAVAACVGLMGSSFAWFSDVETSEGNSFTMGTLDLSPGSDFVAGTGPEGKSDVTPGGDGENGRAVFSNLAPGETGEIVWSMDNAGTLAGTLTIEAEYSSNENELLEPEIAVGDTDSDGELDEAMRFDLFRNETEVAMGASIAQIVEELGAESQVMEPGSTIVYTLNWSVPEDTGNEIQSDDLVLDVRFTLNQQP